MLQNRNLRHDLAALGMLALIVFLAVALVTYDPADPTSEVTRSLGGWYPTDVLVHPQNESFHNACGPLGAVVAEMMLNAMGIGAYYLIFSLAVIDVILLRRRQIDAPVIRTVGWLASLVGLVTLVAMLAPGISAGPVIGSGGYLGALGSGLVQMHFAAAGGLILVLSVIAGGLLISTDYQLLQLAVSAAGAVRAVHSRRRQGKVADEEAWDEEDEYEDDVEDDGDHEDTVEAGGLRVRIRGRDLQDDGDESNDEVDAVDDADGELTENDELDDDEYEYEDDEEEEAGADDTVEDDQDEAAAADGSTRRVDPPQEKPALRVRKPPKRSERDEVIEKLEEASRVEEPQDYELPAVDLLIPGDDICFDEQAKEVRRKAKILEKTFADFGFKVKVVEIETGPVIAQYEVQLEAGLRLSRITGLADDLAIALRVPSVRIVAPIPGENTVGIEVPNETRQVVRLREVIDETNGRINKMRIPLFLGKDVSGNPLTVDLSTLPHLLIAGRTGTGKSVCLNAIISSILMTRRPDEVRMLMIDPKMVELSGYGRLPHLMHPVVTDMRKAEAILAWAVDKMEERYSLLAKAGVRHISSYNQLGEEELFDRLQPEDEEQREAIPTHLPFIVIVADEMADLMMTAGKEVEQHIIRLAQKSRAVGIHLILATQKPTVDVITGLIKSNLPARISFQVASRTDSRVVLDEMGADKLLGNGDMLFLWPGTSTLVRGQGTYLSDDEINAVVDAASTGEQNFVNELVNMKVEDPEDEGSPGPLKKRDDLYESAVDVVVREGRGSVSLLQRTLGIGYGRAARLIDFMAEDGIVGEYAGSQAREVTISLADWEKMQGGDGDDPDPAPAPAPAAPAKKKSNKKEIVPAKARRNPPQPASKEVGLADPSTRSKRRRNTVKLADPDEDDWNDDPEIDEESSELLEEDRAQASATVKSDDRFEADADESDTDDADTLHDEQDEYDDDEYDDEEQDDRESSVVASDAEEEYDDAEEEEEYDEDEVEYENEEDAVAEHDEEEAEEDEEEEYDEDEYEDEEYEEDEEHDEAVASDDDDEEYEDEDEEYEEDDEEAVASDDEDEEYEDEEYEYEEDGEKDAAAADATDGDEADDEQLWDDDEPRWEAESA